MSKFDPIIYHFIPVDEVTWETQPTPMGIIGFYKLYFDQSENKWDLKEIYFRNNDSVEVDLYYGKIPNNEFGFELFKNLDLNLPVIYRDSIIDDILKSDTENL